ncbi:E3 ubiquitin-protein ligase UBR4-like isoform X5 [Halichondria panicea]
MTSRLLTLFDYLLFQFSEPVSELMDQVNNNLFSFCKPVISRADEDTPTSSTPSCTKFYASELQLQYATILSKPSSSTKYKNEGEERIDPKFYNVRPMGGVIITEEAESIEIQTVDDEACRIVLTMEPPKGSPPDSRGYTLLIKSLLVLLDSGIDYEKHQLKLSVRVLAACASHQAFCLASGILSQLPPSISVLQAVVDWDNISLTSSYGSCLLIHTLLVRLKLKLIDLEDLTETLYLTGYSSEESDELLAKVISLVDSREIFINNALQLFQKFLSMPDSTQLPMIAIIAIDLLVCLLHRELSQASKEIQNDALPVILKLADKLLKQGHLSILASSHHLNTLQLSNGDKTAVNVLLSITPYKESLPLFFQSEITERIQFFDHAILIDGKVKDDLLSCDPDELLGSRCVQKYLNLHFRAFSGTQTFSPVRTLKSAIHSCLGVVNSFQDSLSSHTDLIVPIAADALSESLYAKSLGQLVETLPEQEERSMLYQLKLCLSAVSDPEVAKSDRFHRLLCEVYPTAGKLVGSSILSSALFSEEGDISLADLVMLSTKPAAEDLLCSRQIYSVQKCISFLTLLLKQAVTSPDPLIATVLNKQLSSLAATPLSDLEHWAEKVFMGPSGREAGENGLTIALLNAKEFFFFVDILMNSTSRVDLALPKQLLLALLPVAPSIIKLLSRHTQPRLSSIFYHFMLSCTILAATVEGGHLILVKAVEDWLPVCIQVLKDTDNSSSIDTIVLYLSELSSALSYATGVAGVTEKRGLAGEVECLVVDSDPESDDEGAGSGGVVGGDDDSAADESDEEDLNSKLCTFTITHREFTNQHWYCCHTCKLVEGQGVCTICAKVCHKGHDLSYSKFGSFFCDCGAKEDGSCQALVKRDGGGVADSPLSPHERTLFSDNTTEKRMRREEMIPTKKKDATTKEKKAGKDKKKRDQQRQSSFPSLPVTKLAKQIEGYKTELQDYLVSSRIPALTMQMLGQVLPSVVASVDQTSSFGRSAARQAMTDLHHCSKEVDYSDTLMAATLGSQEGAFENVRLNYSGDQGQTIRQLVSGHCVKREAMCALLSLNGKRQHLCVNHDKGKLTVLQLFPILKQADSNRRKLTLTRLTTTSVPFTVLSMSHSPSKEDHLAVSGLKDAQLLTLNSSGQVITRENMHPSVGTNGYIVKTMWVPGQGGELLLVSDTFVKLYNTKVDIVSPSFYFELPMGKIRDATVAITDQDKFVVIMTTQGKIYYQPIIYDLSTQGGPIYFTMDLPIKHTNVVESDNTVNGGGASVYYSHTLRMLFFSYYNGRSFVLAPQSSFSGYNSLAELPLKATPVTPGTKGAGPALVQWTEVQHHPGLVCALTQTLANPVVILVKPDKVQIQELKALPNKARVQGMVAMRQPAAQGDTQSSQSRTTLMTLCEDGSLRIYVTNKNTNTEYWLQQNFQPASPLAVLKSKERSTATSRHSGSPKFSVDFFESCHQLQPNEVEFGGADILHIYNHSQVKTRLNAGSLYLANNKPSGFTVEVSNTVSQMTVIVGLRVQLGSHSMEKAPSFIEVFGRTHTVSFPAGMCRWVDIPLMREESLQADKMVKINFGPSMDPSGVNLIDCIKVYTRTKAGFGWPDDPPPPLPTPSKAGTPGPSQGAESEDESSDMAVIVSTKTVSSSDNLVCHSFDVLANHCLSVDKEKWPNVSEVITKAMNLLTYSVPFQLQYHYKFLLACTVSNREAYLEEKDRIQLSQVVSTLTDAQSKDTLIEPEYYQYLLLLLLKVGKVRPDNLLLLAAQVGSLLGEGVAEGDRVPLFIELLVNVFWKILTKNAASPSVKPVVNPGFTLVNLTVTCLTEVMWLCVLQDHTLLSVVLTHTIKFLFYTDSQVCVPVVKVLMKMLKNKKPRKEKKEEEVVAEESEKAEAAQEDEPSDPVPSDVGGDAEGPPAQDEGGEGSVEQAVENQEQQDFGWQQLEMPPQEPLPAGNQASLLQALGGNQAGLMQALGGNQAALLQALGGNQAGLMQALGGNQAGLMQILSNPDQYMMAMNEFLPDDDAMMNMAIQLSLQQNEEGGGGADMIGEMAQPLLSAMQDMGLPVPQMNQPPSSQSSANEVGQPPSEPPPLPSREEVSGRSSSSSLASLSRAPMSQSPLLIRSWEHVMQDVAAAEENGEGDVEEEPEEPSDDKQADETTEAEMANDSTGEDELEDDDPGTEEDLPLMFDSCDGQDAGEGNTRLASLRHALITQLLERLDQAEEVGGLRSICYLQLLMFLTMNLDRHREDANLLVSLVTTFSSRLFTDEGVGKMVTRDHTHETRLLYLRFINILMSRKKDRSKEGKPAYASHMLFYTTAATLLKDTPLLDYSRQLLSEITTRPQCLQVSEDSPASSSHSTFTHPLDDLNPFFDKQFTKNNTDVFSSYGRLLAEILLVLPCQLKKASESNRNIPPPEFGPDWMATLCDFLLKVSQTIGVGRRHVRKLLLHICGSKENYRLTRDVHALRNHLREVVGTCCTSGFNPEKHTGLPVHMAYTSMLKVIEQLRSCEEIASSRTNNWQAFCQQETNTLPYLLHVSMVLNEGVAPLILRLLHAALAGVPPAKTTPTNAAEREGILRRPSKKDKEAAKEKETTKQPEPDKEACSVLVQTFLSSIDEASLSRFISLFLLQSNSTSLRWQAHKLLHTLYQYSQTPQQVSLVETLWEMWPQMPTYGRKSAQFVDLLGYLSISTPQVLEKESLCQGYVERAIDLLKGLNSQVSTHPNFHIYSQLQNLVDFDGFYLENEPCLVCNDPEIPYSVSKLPAIKSEIKYSPKMILVKLQGSYNIAQLVLRISDIKRTKMVRTVNVYYSNRTVANVIELKNKRKMWMTARSCTLTAGQSEVKIDFPLPIVASNLVIEFRDFYDNLQAGSELLQCPRCQATVSAHPGVCGTCGENVYQCHKCRAINYDEKDPFLCNSCGFSKYAKFDVYVEHKSSSAVDPIETEEDRQKTTSSINSMLETADSMYKVLVQHRNDLDQLLGSLAGGIIVSPGANLPTDTGANKGILLVAQRYSNDCKTTYTELSKIIRGVLASRRELVGYDQRIVEFGTGVIPEEGGPEQNNGTSGSLSIPTVIRVDSAHSTPTPKGHAPHQGWCFGCSSASIEHCINLLKALAFVAPTRRLLVTQNLIRELVRVNLRSGSLQMRIHVRRLLCQLTRDDPVATAELNSYILDRVLDQIAPKHITSNLVAAVRPEIMLLAASLDMEDSCWEERLRTVVRLFQKSQLNTSPAVVTGVTLPCLKILQNVIYPREAVSSKDKKKSFLADCNALQLGDDITIKTSDWLKGDATFDQWKAGMDNRTEQSNEELRQRRLVDKYARIWRLKTIKVSHSRSLLKHDTWLRSMLFNRSSQSARQASCRLVESLCVGEARHRQVLDLLCSFLDQVSKAGESAQEYLELLHTLTSDPTHKWKSYLAMRGVLPQIGDLIAAEIEHMTVLEDSTMSFNLSQGYALKMLTVLLQSFLEVESIKRNYKGKLVSVILAGYLSLKRLVIQRTKRIDESQELLLKMLEELTSGTDQERQEFMATCVETLDRFKDSDLLTPIFVFERLCNIIHPEENDVGEFFLSLDKDPQQEEFLQGRMQGNPYPSSTTGLGPLMRDVKNKICTDCELVALLEDDTGMELLVANKIISLDLPVKDVYKKIWCAQPNKSDRMRVVYRMRGLLGDATEDMVEQLDVAKDEIDEEEGYKMAAILSKCGGLDSVLSRLARVNDFIQGHNLISAALKLLGYCVKLKENRQYLLQPHLNTLNTLLGILDLSLHYEEANSTGIGAAVAEKTLKVTERFLQEASSEAPVLVRTPSHDSTDGGSISPDGEDNRLQVFLKHIESSFVQSSPSIREGLMHVIPFLTFGDPRHMNVLLQHFEPYLNFEKFDLHQSAENTLYLDCFCVVAAGIGKDASGEKLKDLAKETGLTPAAVAYLKSKVPSKIGSFDTPEWKLCISQPSLPYVLKMLAGLCHWHTKTQEILKEVISELHLLEQVASDQHIGTLAENLLEVVAEHPPCYEEIKRVRKATREEKKRRAMAMRQKELGALGMEVNEKGQVIAQSTLVSEMEGQLIEESGLKCCICLEGYKNQPQKILGIYTYTRKVALDEFENKPRKTVGYSTVSHFNVVHYECHSAAVKLARSRDEWESATLQNANTKCNALLPIWGPEISHTNFSSSVARFHNYLQECTGLFDPSFHTLAHDIRLLLVRFAYEKSFSGESGGGGPQSNMHLLPYYLHVGAHVMNLSHCYQREERNLATFLAAAPDTWVSSAYELDGPQYQLVVSLFIQSLSEWEEHRTTILKRLLVLAHARNSSSSLIKSLSSSSPAEFSVYKPLLMMFSLVDSLHRVLKTTLSVSGSDLPTALLEHVRTNDSTVLEASDKLLTEFQDQVQLCESFQEFLDVMGLLVAIDNPDVFLAELLSLVTVTTASDN